jgi:hypothetical protein
MRLNLQGVFSNLEDVFSASSNNISPPVFVAASDADDGFAGEVGQPEE